MRSFQRAGLRPVKPPPGVQILPLLEMFSIKYDALSGLLLPKSRFCIRGDKEKSEDGRKVGLYSPVVSSDVIRTLFCIVVLFALKIRQMDIRTAFLNGSTPKTYYVQLPLGHPLRKRGYVWASDVSVYGLRDSPFYWYQRLTSEFEKYGLKKFVLDGCVFTSSKLTVIVYVDDLLYVSKDERELDTFEAFLERVFSVKKTSNVQKFVGFEVRKNKSGSITLHGERMITDLAKKWQVIGCKKREVPYVYGTQFYPNDEPCDRKLYLSLVGSLSFLGGLCRPDIGFSVHVLTRHNHSPTKKLFKMARNVLCYLYHTRKEGLCYERNAPNGGVSLDLVAYSDADHGNSLVNRKSVSGHVLELCGNVIDYSVKKQSCVAKSSFAAEYVALATSVEKTLFIYQLLKFLKFKLKAPPKMLCDNRSTIKSFSSQEVTKRSRYIDIEYHYSKDKFQKRKMRLFYVDTKDNVADLLTKLVRPDIFKRLKRRLVRQA